jgi:Flp pilus assembly protein TadG
MKLFSLSEQRIKADMGAALVEAAVALPVFLAVMLFSVVLMHFCFKLVQFQQSLSEATRNAFSLNKTQRGGSWQAYIESTLQEGTQNFKGIKDLNLRQVEQQPVKFLATQCTGWSCANSAKPGDTFAIEYVVTADILPNSIAGISLPQIQFRSKAVATVMREQDE